MEDCVQVETAWDHTTFLRASISDLANWHETAQVALLSSKET
jgi:hypothetical protein